jgi:hypothetical protein
MLPAQGEDQIADAICLILRARVEEDTAAVTADDHAILECGAQVMLQLACLQPVQQRLNVPRIVKVDLQPPVVVHVRTQVAFDAIEAKIRRQLAAERSTSTRAGRSTRRR